MFDYAQRASWRACLKKSDSGVKRESLKYNILGLKKKLKRNIFLKFPRGNNALGLPTIVLFVFITTWPFDYQIATTTTIISKSLCVPLCFVSRVFLTFFLVFSIPQFVKLFLHFLCFAGAHVLAGNPNNEVLELGRWT